MASNTFLYAPFEFDLKEGWQANLWSKPGVTMPQVLIGPDNLEEVEKWVLRLVGAKQDTALTPRELRAIARAGAPSHAVDSDDPQAINLSTWSGFLAKWVDKSIVYRGLALQRSTYVLAATLSFKETMPSTITDDVCSMIEHVRLTE